MQNILIQKIFCTATKSNTYVYNVSSHQVVKSIHGLQLYSAAFTRLLLNEKMLDACEDIMETPNILLHHTKAHSKPPNTGSPFPMHQVMKILTHFSSLMDYFADMQQYIVTFTVYNWYHMNKGKKACIDRKRREKCLLHITSWNSSAQFFKILPLQRWAVES